MKTPISSVYDLTCLYANPLHTILVEDDGQVVYEIKTEDGVTTIQHHSRGGRPATIGTIEWKREGHTYINIGKQSFKAGDLLRLLPATGDREFVGPTGREFVWRVGGDRLELKPKDSPKEILAAYYVEHTRIFKKAEPAYLSLGNEAINMLDTVVTTWVWMAVLLRGQRSRRISSLDSATPWMMTPQTS